MDIIVTDRCQGCGACLLTCPEHAIRPHGRPLLVVRELCTGCLECVEVCPADAIEALIPGAAIPGAAIPGAAPGAVPGGGEGS